MSTPNLLEFARMITSGAIRVVDLTHTLCPEFPNIVLTPEFGQCAPFRIKEVFRYDERGLAWYWNKFHSRRTYPDAFRCADHWVSEKLHCPRRDDRRLGSSARQCRLPVHNSIRRSVKIN